jgi:hypothetical protein
MGKEFLPYQQCLDLKALGYNEHPLGAYYCKDGTLEYTDDGPNRNSDLDEAPDWCKAHCSAILYQEAFRWFREKKDLFSWIYIGRNAKYFYAILKESRYVVFEGIATTYEEAEVNCIKSLIKISKKINAH